MGWEHESECNYQQGSTQQTCVLNLAHEAITIYLWGQTTLEMGSVDSFVGLKGDQVALGFSFFTGERELPNLARGLITYRFQRPSARLELKY